MDSADTGRSERSAGSMPESVARRPPGQITSDLILRIDGETATTVELAQSESADLEPVAGGRDTRTGMLASRTVEHALAERGLSGEQAGVVRSVNESGYAVEDLEAAAGSGKRHREDPQLALRSFHPLASRRPRFRDHLMEGRNAA